MTILPESVPCKWCGTDTTATAIAECPGCWEVRSKVEADPVLALRVLTGLDDQLHALTLADAHRWSRIVNAGETVAIVRLPILVADFAHLANVWPDAGIADSESLAAAFVAAARPSEPAEG